MTLEEAMDELKAARDELMRERTRQTIKIPAHQLLRVLFDLPSPDHGTIERWFDTTDGSRRVSVLFHPEKVFSRLGYAIEITGEVRDGVGRNPS